MQNSEFKLFIMNLTQCQFSSVEDQSQVKTLDWILKYIVIKTNLIFISEFWDLSQNSVKIHKRINSHLNLNQYKNGKNKLRIGCSLKSHHFYTETLRFASNSWFNHNHFINF